MLTQTQGDEKFPFPRRFFFGFATASVGDGEDEEVLVLVSSSCTVARVVDTALLTFVFLPGLGTLVAASPSVAALDGKGLRFFSSVLCSMWLTAVVVTSMAGSGFGLNSGLRGAPANMFQPILGVAGTGTPMG